MYKQGQHITAAYELAADDTWYDLGDEVETHELMTFATWIELDVGDGTGFRVRLLAKNPYSTTLEYVLPIKTVSASDVKVEDHYVEFNDDSDQKMIITWSLDGVIPKVQVQVQADDVDTGGGDKIEVDSAVYTAV